MFRGILDDRLFCEACHLAKHRRSVYKSIDERCLSPFDCIHSDVWGPCSTTSLTGCHWFVIFVDDCTRTMWTYLLRSKAEVPSVISQFCELIQTQFGVKVRRFRSDNGSEFFNAIVNSYFSDRGIVHESSCINTPQQNGLEERRLGYTLAMTRSLLFEANLPKHYWGEAVLTSTYLMNRTPMKIIGYQSPLGLLGAAFPNQKLFLGLPARIFGCTAFVHQKSGKLDPRAQKCVFVGYSSTQKGYRCYHPTTRKFYVSADVVFHESEPFFRREEVPRDVVESENPVSLQFLSLPGQETGAAEKELQPSEIENLEMPRLDLPEEIEDLAEGTKEETGESNVLVDDTEEALTEQVVISSPPESASDDLGWPIALRKGVRSCRSTVRYPIGQYVKYEKLGSTFKSFLTSLGEITVPTRVEEALQDPSWKAAMDKEMAALEKNDMWEIVCLPKGKRAVGCKWVYTLKFDCSGVLERLKARLVAKGYTQREGVDYGETFAPVAKFNIVRVLIAVAAKCAWDVLQFDVKNAFLHGELEEEVYMQLPPGYQQPGQENRVCKLKKALYGLKQSRRAWFGRFTKTMLNLGYHQARGDHTLFIKHGASGATTILIVYVDDILITGSDLVEIQHLSDALSGQFDMKKLGVLKYFLGIEFAHSKAGICMSQHKYTLDLLKETGQLACKSAATPLDPNVKIGKGEDGAYCWTWPSIHTRGGPYP